MIRGIEFYITPAGGIMIHDDNGVRKLTQSERQFVSEMIERIGEFYPDSLKALSKEYDKSHFNIPLFEYKIVVRFIKCNWGNFDSTMDIDDVGNFNFEEVDCPLRGECKLEGVVCKPRFNSKLSDRELEIMQMLCDQESYDIIANRLCISVETAKTHKRNAFKRTNVHSFAEFVLYARKNHLFQD